MNNVFMIIAALSLDARNGFLWRQCLAPVNRGKRY
jgi:hypothetical protein